MGMSRFIIQGGKKLDGELPVYGSKNAALPLLAAALLTDKPVTLSAIPDITDVHNMQNILTDLGATMETGNDTVTVHARNLNPKSLAESPIGLLRGSILLLGALLGRTRHVSLPRPGGDIIGARPIDVHLDGLRQLGATVQAEAAAVTIDGNNLRAGNVTLNEFSVTATENIMLTAATLPGITTINIAAAEPHIVALAAMLTQMGAAVTGAGTHTVTVTGTTALRGVTFTNIPDMLEAGSFILLAAASHSPLTIANVPLADLTLFFKKLDAIGITYRIDGTSVNVLPSKLSSFCIQTLPHPGLATDLQAPFTILATQATGNSLIHDPLYENRFRHVPELQKMGARITVCDPHRIIVEGPTPLAGRHIPSLDIRSGMTLLMAGLIATGETVLEQAETIDRGYARLEERLTAIGADIKRDST